MEVAYFIIGPSIIFVLSLILAFVVLTNKDTPCISGDRSAFIALAIMNYVMCAVGPLPWTKPSEWLSTFNLALYVIGIFALIFIVVVITAKTVPLPFVSTYRTAFTILALIIFLKWAVFTIQYAILINS